ncbi:MAG: YraN family protein [Gammaproteobacteria bacterium]|nr:MAG: YraN family protein [Gammaproteobacteria bacterium]
MSTRATGIHWENAALLHVQNAGLELLDRNFHCRLGEIDLILTDRDTIVFAEVRYRGDGTRGDGAASVGAAKQAKLVRAAQLWLQAQPRYASLPCRFDVIGCTGTPQRPQFDWVRNAFDAV